MTPWQVIIFAPSVALALAAGMVFFFLGRTFFRNRRLLKGTCDIASVLVWISTLYVVGKAWETASHSPPAIPADRMWLLSALMSLQVFVILFAMHVAWRKRLRVARFIRRAFRKPAKNPV